MRVLSQPRRLGALLPLLSLLLAAPAPSADPVATVETVDAALNAHDASAVLELMADGGTVQDDRAPQTREQVLGWVGQLIAENVHVELVGQPQVEPALLPRDGTTVSWQAELTLDRFRALGRPSVKATVGTVVVGGRIVHLWVRPDPNWPEAP